MRLGRCRVCAQSDWDGRLSKEWMTTLAGSLVSGSGGEIKEGGGWDDGTKDERLR